MRRSSIEFFLKCFLWINVSIFSLTTHANTLSVTVSGLTGTNSVSFTNTINGDTLQFTTANVNPQVFKNTYQSGDIYQVQIIQQPANQLCWLSATSPVVFGTFGSADIALSFKCGLNAANNKTACAAKNASCGVPITGTINGFTMSWNTYLPLTNTINGDAMALNSYSIVNSAFSLDLAVPVGSKYNL